MKKLTIELDDKTFAWLEVLAVGLAKEDLSDDEFKARIETMHNAKTNDFEHGVIDIIQEIAGSLSDGVSRSGSWERNCLNQLTGYDGTVIPDMYADCIKDKG